MYAAIELNIKTAVIYNQKEDNIHYMKQSQMCAIFFLWYIMHHLWIYAIWCTAQRLILTSLIKRYLSSMCTAMKSEIYSSKILVIYPVDWYLMYLITISALIILKFSFYYKFYAFCISHAHKISYATLQHFLTFSFLTFINLPASCQSLLHSSCLSHIIGSLSDNIFKFDIFQINLYSRYIVIFQ